MGQAFTRAVDVAGLDWRHTSQNDAGKGATEPAIVEQALGKAAACRNCSHTQARAGLSVVAKHEKAIAHRTAKEMRLKGVPDPDESSSDSSDNSSSSSSGC